MLNSWKFLVVILTLLINHNSKISIENSFLLLDKCIILLLITPWHQHCLSILVWIINLNKYNHISYLVIRLLISPCYKYQYLSPINRLFTKINSHPLRSQNVELTFHIIRIKILTFENQSVNHSMLSESMSILYGISHCWSPHVFRINVHSLCNQQLLITPCYQNQCPYS